MQETIDRLREQNFTDTLALDSGVRHFDFIVAHVINNSISHPFNYLTIKTSHLLWRTINPKSSFTTSDR